MTSHSERTPPPNPPAVDELTNTPIVQVKAEFPQRTPATHRASGYKHLSTNQLPAEQNQDSMADETKGYWIGPCPVQGFATTFLDTEETQGKPKVSNKYFAPKKVKIRKEADLYKAFDKFVNGRKLAPGFELVDTSNALDPNSRPGSQIRPDGNLYPKGTIKDGHRNQMDKASMACEFKLGHHHDILVVDGDRSLHDPLAPLEATAEERRRNRGQIVSYLVEMAARQHRTHIFMLFVFHPYARFIRWDRSGIIVTDRFDYVKDCSPLVDFFWRYSQLTSAQRGYDTTVELATTAETKHAHKYLAEWAPRDGVHRDVYKVQVPSGSGYRSFLVWGALAEPASPLGRGTKGWPALEVKAGPKGPQLSTKPVFVKEQWRGKDVSKEATTLKLLNDNGVEHVPTLVCGGDISGDFQTTLSHEYAEANWRVVSKDKDQVKKIETRIHVRLATAEVGTPLELFKSTHEMLAAVHYAFIGHMQAYNKCGLLHRDVSGGNILILPGKKGLLNDWDLAILINEIQDARTGERTASFLSFLYPFRHTKSLSLGNLAVYRVRNIFHQYTNEAPLPTGGAFKVTLLDGSIFPFVREFDGKFQFKKSPSLTAFIYDAIDALATWRLETTLLTRGKLHKDKDALWHADPLQKTHNDLKELFERALAENTPWPSDDAAEYQLDGSRSAGHRISTKRKVTEPLDAGSSKKPKRSSAN
ncbi:hypothetical protein ONZ45_g13724 [Pleurotus djamor]|nr:hypothetical protein ONZ45_g13724 [Pleurotus djamor]